MFIIQTAIASVKDTGQDLEHCQTLIKKFNDFQKVYKSLGQNCYCSINACLQELLVEKSDVHSLNELASSLISEEHSGEAMIKSMQSDVYSRSIK